MINEFMFCPNCGIGDQEKNTYCRKCGLFLPDFEKLKKRETPPEEHLKANSVLNIMTAVVSLTLAILLHVWFYGNENTPAIVFITAGFLFAMFAWQAQIFWRNLKLKKQIIIPKRAGTDAKEPAQKVKSLSEPDLENFVPANAAVKTTNKLKTEKSS